MRLKDVIGREISADDCLKVHNDIMRSHIGWDLKLIKGDKMFRKIDLKNFDVIKFAKSKCENERYGFVNLEHNTIVLLNDTGFHSLDSFDDCFNYVGDSSYVDRYNIIEVYRPKHSGAINFAIRSCDFDLFDKFWERPETLELSMDDIAEKFGVDVNQLKIKK